MDRLMVIWMGERMHGSKVYMGEWKDGLTTEETDFFIHSNIHLCIYPSGSSSNSLPLS